jgi:hypothetical protein
MEVDSLKKGYIYVLFMLIAATLGGCNNYLGNKDVGQYDHKNSTELLKVGNDNNNDNNNRNGDHGLDRDEITDQNPNFLNLNTDNETHVNNIGVEIQQVRDVIGVNNTFKAGPIWQNGNTMHVTVYSDRNLTEQQENQARKQLERELTTALPTYRIHLNIRNR